MSQIASIYCMAANTEQAKKYREAVNDRQRDMDGDDSINESGQQPFGEDNALQRVGGLHTDSESQESKPKQDTSIPDQCPPDLFYNDRESRKYTTSSRMQNVQSDMTYRALELLHLGGPSLIMDIGCGSGLSGEILSSVTPADGGPHIWVGMDISASMLDIALQRDVEGDLLLSDIGQGVPFRAGSFDAAVSISAIQWLCNAESSEVSPQGRLSRFFNGLYVSLRRGGRAVCQFYPKNDAQRSLISSAAIKAGFGAGILEDDPGTKNTKLYLVLTVGGAETQGDVTTVVKNMRDVDVQDGRRKFSDIRKKERRGNKAWVSNFLSAQTSKGNADSETIMRKKEQMEKKGKVVKASSKYTGRSRRRVAF
ncbi:MAG: hypothetical protein Q9166_006968 [cf. Caloplaca sp. 2 TL-2023]